MALEAHSSHYSQPLDKNPFSSFKMEFNNQMKKFNRTSGGRAITKAEFFPVFNLAWNRSMTADNIKAGFKQTGIWPPDSEALPDYLFAVNNESESSGFGSVRSWEIWTSSVCCPVPWSVFFYCKYMYMYRFDTHWFAFCLLHLLATYQWVQQHRRRQLPLPLPLPLILLQMRKKKVGFIITYKHRHIWLKTEPVS